MTTPKRYPSPLVDSTEHPGLRVGFQTALVAKCHWISISICLAVSFGMMACSSSQAPKKSRLYSPPLQSTSVTNLPHRAIREIAVMPLTVPGERGVSPDMVELLQPDLITAFEANTTLQITNANRPDAVQNAYDSVARAAISVKERSMQFARRSGADAALVGEVTRFDDSDGGKFGAQKPSAVSFSLQLIDAATGEQLWTAGYDRKDESLTDNLFRLPEVAKDGMQFRTASELVRQGFQDAAKDLEKSRLGQAYPSSRSALPTPSRETTPPSRSRMGNL